jgi:hypothetical protein
VIGPGRTSGTSDRDAKGVVFQRLFGRSEVTAQNWTGRAVFAPSVAVSSKVSIVLVLMIRACHHRWSLVTWENTHLEQTYSVRNYRNQAQDIANLCNV